MDRAIVYPGALPQETDLLDTNLFAMIGAAFHDQVLIGTNTAVGGLACAPLPVNIANGSILQLDEIAAAGRTVRPRSPGSPSW